MRPGFLAIVVAAIVGLVLLGRVMTNGDEYIYAGEARMLTHARLVPIPGDPLPGTRVVPSFEGARYPPGWPLVLALGALWSFRAMFVVALVVHLLGGAAMARMVVRRGLPSVLAAGWLFHPLFWGFSRTLLSDVPAAALLLMAMDAWENRRIKTSALAIGYSFLVRIASFTQVAGFALAISNDLRRKWRPAVVLALGAACGVAILLLVNTLKDGHPFRSPYASTNQHLLTVAMFKQNLWIYGLGLVLIPPFPLVCLLVRPRSCDRWALVAIPVVAFFLFYGYRELALGFFENLLGGQRLILAAHAALLIATVDVWSRIPLVRSSPALLALGIAAAMAHHFAVRHIDRRFAPVARAVAACGPETVAFNVYASRVALSTDASSYHLLDDRKPTTLPDVAVVASRFQTFRYEAPLAFRVPDWVGRSSVSCQRFGDFYIFDFTGRCPAAGRACD